MREMVKFFGDELSKNETLLSSERKAVRSILNLFVEGAFAYLAVDHADIDEEEFHLKCLSSFRVKVGEEWDGIIAKVAASRSAIEVDDEEDESDGSDDEDVEGNMEAPKMVDSEEEGAR